MPKLSRKKSETRISFNTSAVTLLTYYARSYRIKLFINHHDIDVPSTCHNRYGQFMVKIFNVRK